MKKRTKVRDTQFMTHWNLSWVGEDSNESMRGAVFIKYLNTFNFCKKESDSMDEEKKIKVINEVVDDYFKNGTKENSVAAKELMPHFITAGIFTKDEKKGLPIRKVLRALDDQNTLDSIPSAHAERKEKGTFWYFLRTGFDYVSESPNDTGITKKKKVKASRASSDEHYLLNLCDEVLQEQAARQHKFGFILGDYHKDGKTRTALPVDAYYQGHNLVIEFMERPQAESDEFSDKQDRRTISGVSRSEQRKIYAERRKKGLSNNGIRLAEIDFSEFICDSNNQLIRETDKDLEIVKQYLKEFL